MGRDRRAEGGGMGTEKAKGKGETQKFFFKVKNSQRL